MEMSGKYIMLVQKPMYGIESKNRKEYEKIRWQ